MRSLDLSNLLYARKFMYRNSTVKQINTDLWAEIWPEIFEHLLHEACKQWESWQKTKAAIGKHTGTPDYGRGMETI